MAKTIDDVRQIRTVDTTIVDKHKKRMLNQVGAHRLRELREARGLTQVELAALLGVTQNRISRLEHAGIQRTQIDTLRRYVEAVGGELVLEVVIEARRIQIA